MCVAECKSTDVFIGYELTLLAVSAINWLQSVPLDQLVILERVAWRWIPLGFSDS